MNLWLHKKESVTREWLKMPQADSTDLVRYTIAYAGSMNQMRLQKILYLTEGYHLGKFRQSLITDDFEAWMKGPIALKVWNFLKNLYLVYDPISLSRICTEKAEQLEARLRANLHPEQMTLLESVLDMTSNLTDYELDNLIQRSTPWRNAREGADTATICREVISKDEMMTYYSTQQDLVISKIK